MALISMYTGSTTVMVNVFIRNSLTGQGMTGLTPSTPGLICYYFIAGAVAPVQVSLSAMTLGTWASGGFVEVDAVHAPGLYQLGLPNVAWGGNRLVTLVFSGASNMQEATVDVELTATNNQDAVRGGLTALPDGAMQFRKNQALNGFSFVMFNQADGRTPMPGLTVTAYVSKDGGAFAQTDNMPTELVSPLFSGVYKINLSANDTNGDTLFYAFTAPGAQSTLIGVVPQP